MAGTSGSVEFTVTAGNLDQLWESAHQSIEDLLWQRKEEYWSMELVSIEAADVVEAASMGGVQTSRVTRWAGTFRYTGQTLFRRP